MKSKRISIDGRTVEVTLEGDEATAEVEETEKEKLVQEAEHQAKNVFGYDRVKESFTLGPHEGSSDIQVGVVVGGDRGRTTSYKFPIGLDADFGNLDGVGSGVQYCPLYDGDGEINYKNAPEIDGPAMVLYFGLE